jgi:hypothetical protein
MSFFKDNRHFSQVIFILKQYLFWMLLFQFLRTIFLLYNIDEASGNSFIEVIKAYWAALILDNSAAGYIMMFPLLMGLFKSIILPKVFYRINQAYHYLMIVLAVGISIAELPLYDEWKVKLNFRALTYLARPAEVFQTASVAHVVWGVLAIVLISALAIYAFNRIVLSKKYAQTSLYGALAHLVFLPIFFIWGIRGGLQPIPVHLSDAYYSKARF